MNGLQYLSIWKMASADGGIWGHVVDKYWTGRNTYGDDDIVNESFRLLVERNDCKIGIVFVPPSLYVKIEIGHEIELDPNSSA
jgi:hypothetical protein